MILCIWFYAATSSGFVVTPASSLDMMAARFVASMMMHINVEKDVKNGIQMMKYSVNHYKQFNNVIPAFLIGFNCTLISLIVEINVMIILSSLKDILGVVLKYVSLAAIANIPRFYYASLVEHKMCLVKDLNLDITEFRSETQPLNGAPSYIHVLRAIYKVWRVTFCTVSFYFMPFCAIFLNF